MGRWLVELSGDTSDLRVLANQFFEPDLCIELHDDRYTLSSSDFSALSDARLVLDHGHGLIELMNGAICLGDPSQRPVSASTVFYQREDGGRDAFLLAEPAELRLRSQLSAQHIRGADPATEAIPRLPVGLARLNAARTNPHIEEVVRGLANAEPEFAVLHRLLEAVEVDMGGSEDAIVERGWATRRELKQFTHTANTIGRRHATGKFQPPTRPMALKEAQALIRRIANAWLRDVYGVDVD